MIAMRLVRLEPGAAMPGVRVHPLRVAIAIAVLCALLLEVTASLAAHPNHGAPAFRTYTTPATTVGPIDPRC